MAMPPDVLLLTFADRLAPLQRLLVSSAAHGLPSLAYGPLLLDEELVVGRRLK